MLEHAEVCIETSKDTYKFFKSMVETIKEQVRDDKEAERCYLRFSSYYKEENSVYKRKRCLISGNFRAWIETFEKMEDMACLVPEICEAVVQAAGGATGVMYRFFGHNDPVDKCYNFNDVEQFVRVIDDFSTLSEKERMLHETFTILFTCDRGVTHELVRMRESSFAQESTRYCNYGSEKHGKQVSVISPLFFEEGTEAYAEWEAAMLDAERHYLRLTEDLKVPAQQARTVLPHSTKVDIVMTTNLREWKHIFNLRACDATGPCHPQMSEIMQPCFTEMRLAYPFAFGDLYMKHEVTP